MSLSRLNFKIDTTKNVRITYNGTIYWTAPITVEITCEYHFRTNKWKCPLFVGTWCYSANEVDLVTSKLHIDISQRLEYDWIIMTAPANKIIGHRYQEEMIHGDWDVGVYWQFVLFIQKSSSKKGPKNG